MKISESQIQEACADLLALDDWRRIRTDLKRLRGMGVQEKGMADDLFIRYTPSPYEIHMDGVDPTNTRAIGWWKKGLECQAQVLFIEWKRIKKTRKRQWHDGPGEGDVEVPTVAAQHQKDWHRLERARGALTLIAGEDFAATVDGFKEFYKNSGLMRRKIIS